MFGNKDKADRFEFGDFDHDYGLVVEIEAAADTGKTATMIAITLDLVNFLGYKGSDVHGNLWVDLEGYNQHDNAGIREYLSEVLVKGYRHKIILVDEIDSVYPSRFFMEKKQTLELVKLNQMTKTENWFLFTRHLGTAVDKLLRDCSNISVCPRYIPAEDIIIIELENGVDCIEKTLRRIIYPASCGFR